MHNRIVDIKNESKRTKMFYKQFTVWQFAKMSTRKNFISKYLAF